MNNLFKATALAMSASAFVTFDPSTLQQEELEQMLVENQEAQENFKVLPCQYWFDGGWYDLTNFTQATALTYTSPPDATDTDPRMYFSLCTTLEKTTSGAAGGLTNQPACANNDMFAVFTNSDTTASTCTDYSTNVDTSITQVTGGTVKSSTICDVTSDDNECKTLTMEYTATSGALFTVQMICAETPIVTAPATIGPLVMMGKDSNGIEMYQTTLTGAIACSTYSMNAFFQFVQDYNWLFAIILICIGLPFCFMGRKFFSCIVFVVGIMCTVSIIMLLFYSTFLDSNTEVWVFWVVLSCSILAGVAVGFVLFKCQKLGAACVAGWGGFLGGLIINTAILWTAGQEWLFWVVAIGCALAAAVSAFFFYFPVVITVTSFAGAYMFIRGISLFIPDSYPNEFTLINELESGTIPHMEWYFYLYLAFMLLFTVIGMVVQCKHLKKEKEEHGEENIHHPYANRYT